MGTHVLAGAVNDVLTGWEDQYSVLKEQEVVTLMSCRYELSAEDLDFVRRLTSRLRSAPANSGPTMDNASLYAAPHRASTVGQAGC